MNTKTSSKKLEGVSETLLMTLLVRARESKRSNPLIKDETAVALVEQLDCDFSRLRMQRHDEIAVIMRMRKFDDYVCGFLTRHPDAVIVHIGCGLDTRFERVDNGHVEWFDLDMPDVIELRHELLGKQKARYHTIAGSVFEDDWLEEVARLKPRPFMFIAEGVLPYFEEEQVKGLFLKLLAHFSGCELVCDAHTPFVIWADNLHLAFSGIKARMKWKLRNPRDVEGWGADIRLIEEWFYYTDDEPLMESFRWLRLIPGFAKASGIHRFRLGKRGGHV